MPRSTNSSKLLYLMVSARIAKENESFSVKVCNKSTTYNVLLVSAAFEIYNI